MMSLVLFGKIGLRWNFTFSFSFWLQLYIGWTSRPALSSRARSCGLHCTTSKIGKKKKKKKKDWRQQNSICCSEKRVFHYFDYYCLSLLPLFLQHTNTFLVEDSALFFSPFFNYLRISYFFLNNRIILVWNSNRTCYWIQI